MEFLKEEALFFKSGSNGVHFIGIGGIGISALARYFLSQGWRVTGSDLKSSDITDDLERAGATVFIEHKTSNIRPGTQLVIYSPAVKKNNPELKASRELRIKTLSYPEALGALTKEYYTIAVSGSHGKSTTTALIGLILIKAGLDPTVIVGTKLKEFRSSANNPASTRLIRQGEAGESGSNFRMGKSKYLVIEADEWNRSFHHYFPKVVVLTNIDKEHLDTYKTEKGVVAGFGRYLKNLPKDGILIANFKDKNIRLLAGRIRKQKRVKVIFYNRGKFQKHDLGIPGAHNQLNAEAAWQTFGVIANNANLGQNNSNLRKIANEVFRNYHGAWRRLEQLPTSNFQPLITIYSDYAHHPTEIKATLQALREKYAHANIICVFQPHQQDRLTRLFSEFINAFDAADTVVILPVYKVEGRDEVQIKGAKDSFALVQKIKNHKQYAFYAPDFLAAMKMVKNYTESGSVAVFMGAGDLDSQLRKFLLY